MFRDTFAVELLLAGNTIDKVSILLGHRSVKMTEKHYLPWVKARQEQLAASVQRSWFPEVVDGPPLSPASGKVQREPGFLILACRSIKMLLRLGAMRISRLKAANLEVKA